MNTNAHVYDAAPFTANDVGSVAATSGSPVDGFSWLTFTQSRHVPEPGCVSPVLHRVPSVARATTSVFPVTGLSSAAGEPAAVNVPTTSQLAGQAPVLSCFLVWMLPSPACTSTRRIQPGLITTAGVPVRAVPPRLVHADSAPPENSAVRSAPPVSSANTWMPPLATATAVGAPTRPNWPRLCQEPYAPLAPPCWMSQSRPSASMVNATRLPSPARASAGGELIEPPRLVNEGLQASGLLVASVLTQTSVSTFWSATCRRPSACSASAGWPENPSLPEITVHWSVLKSSRSPWWPCTRRPMLSVYAYSSVPTDAPGTGVAWTAVTRAFCCTASAGPGGPPSRRDCQADQEPWNEVCWRMLPEARANTSSRPDAHDAAA